MSMVKSKGSAYPFVFVLMLAGCAGRHPPDSSASSLLGTAPRRDAITFWGHSTCYIDIDGVGIVTDPVLAKGYSPWHRRQVPAPPPSSYAGADFILISHAHHDHLNKPTLRQFAKSVTVLCPEPSAKIIRKLGMNVQAMKPGDSWAFAGGTIIAVAAHHPGGRNSLNAEPDGRALGYIIRTSGKTIYYSGDTDYFPGIAEVGKTYRPNVALLNVNTHLPQADALRAFFDLGSPTIIPIHSVAYSGPDYKRNLRRREEFSDMLGGLSVPLGIGESHSLKK